MPNETSAAEIVECCSWCRHPATHCRSAACDDTPTYDGTLRWGQWVELEPEIRSGAE